MVQILDEAVCISYSVNNLGKGLHLTIPPPAMGLAKNSAYPFSLCCRIHQLLLCRGVRSIPNQCPRYDTKQSDGEVPVMLELWGMWITPLMPLPPGLLWPGVVAPDRFLSIGQIEVN